jgi:general secretion pathway protein D
MNDTPFPGICRICLAVLCLTLAGCAGKALHREGMDLVATGYPQEGLLKLEQASREAPDNPVFRMAYQNARKRITARWLVDARREQEAGGFDAAEASYRLVLGVDADNAEARAGLLGLTQARRHAVLLREAKDLTAAGQRDAAAKKIAQVLADDPAHKEARALRQSIEEQAGSEQALGMPLGESFRKPVTLEFRDANLKQVLEALSLHSGLNFVLDKDVPPNLTVTIVLRDTSVADALDLILTTHQLRRRLLNENSVLIYPDTVAKQSDHQELVVKNVFLVNAEAKQVASMLKTVLKMKNVFSDDKLNLLMMRDTPAMIQLAERMVSTQDVAEPEVMLDVAIVEVMRSSLENLGIQFPTQLTLTPLPETGTTLTLRDLQRLNPSRLGAAISPLNINLQDDTGASNMLANPSIRTHNREKAMIRIGDRVPVITTTATSTGFVSDNVQYIDVGLKLEVEPTIYPQDEVSIRLALEVSSVVKETVSNNGTTSYQIGSRNASTVLRLKDGETQILGGLINDDDQRAANRFPGLNRLPGLGRLFSSQSDNNQKTELLLSITPRIVRRLAPPQGIPGTFWSGTENDPRLRAPLAPRASPGAEKAAPILSAPPSSAAPASTPMPTLVPDTPAVQPPPATAVPPETQVAPEGAATLMQSGPAEVKPADVEVIP